MITGRRLADLDVIWRNTAERIRSLVVDLAPDEAETPVAAANGISIRTLVARLVSTGRDALDGSVHGVLEGSDDPDAAPLPELLERWGEQSDDLVALVRSDPQSRRLLVDLVSVEHDLRTALGAHGARDDDAVVAAIEIMGDALTARMAGRPGLRITCEQWGHDTADVCREILVADRFELFRGMNGRRSADEVRRWMWSTDPTPFLPYFAVYGSLRDTALDEPDPTIPPEYAERLRAQSWREPLPT